MCRFSGEAGVQHSGGPADGHLGQRPPYQGGAGAQDGRARLRVVSRLLRHGLLKASFIPPLEIRELRELVRYRQTVVTEHTAVANRIQKLIESANIKLGQVASDVLGLSGRLMLRALAAGETKRRETGGAGAGEVEEQEGRVTAGVGGRLTPVQRWVLRELLTRVEELEAALTRVETRIGEEVAACADPFVPEAVELLESIPGRGPTARRRRSWPRSASI